MDRKKGKAWAVGAATCKVTDASAHVLHFYKLPQDKAGLWQSGFKMQLTKACRRIVDGS